MAIKQLRGIVAKRGYIMEYWIKLHEARNYLTDKKTGKKTKSTISRKTSICVYEGETQL